MGINRTTGHTGQQEIKNNPPMKILEKISRFSPVEPTAPPAAVAPEPSGPCRCGCSRWWQPHGSIDWRCESCQPPPSRSLVARWVDCRPRVVAELLVTFCRPWCPRCGGWQGIEQEWSDGSATLACRTCRCELPDVPAAILETEELEAGT